MQNLEEKEHMIIRDDELVTIMQQQKEDKFTETNGEIVVGHDMNAEREGFASRSACTFLHRWELPVNYPVFSLVMVICHYLERIWRIVLTPNFLYDIYNHE